MDLSALGDIFAGGLYDPFVLKCATRALALLAGEKDVSALSRIIDYKVAWLLSSR